MKLNEIHQSAVTPKVSYRENGDKSWTVRIEYAPDKVYVHTNKKQAVLQQIVKDKYGPRVL